MNKVKKKNKRKGKKNQCYGCNQQEECKEMIKKGYKIYYNPKTGSCIISKEKLNF